MSDSYSTNLEFLSLWSCHSWPRSRRTPSIVEQTKVVAFLRKGTINAIVAVQVGNHTVVGAGQFVDGPRLPAPHVEAGPLFELPGEVVKKAREAAGVLALGGQVDGVPVHSLRSGSEQASVGLHTDRDVPELTYK